MLADYPGLFKGLAVKEGVEMNSGTNSHKVGENCNTPSPLRGGLIKIGPKGKGDGLKREGKEIGPSVNEEAHLDVEAQSKTLGHPSPHSLYKESSTNPRTHSERFPAKPCRNPEPARNPRPGSPSRRRHPPPSRRRRRSSSSSPSPPQRRHSSSSPPPICRCEIIPSRRRR